MHPCTFCGEPIDDHVNYCGWVCHVDHARVLGGKEHLPNGLPIRCIKHDGTMLEHEHGDHPDYKFPVEVEFVGEKVRLPEWSADHYDEYANEVHALIYSDGFVAVTLYECCYAMWSLANGKLLGGSLWHQDHWRLTQASIETIKERKNG